MGALVENGVWADALKSLGLRFARCEVRCHAAIDDDALKIIFVVSRPSRQEHHFINAHRVLTCERYLKVFLMTSKIVALGSLSSFLQNLLLFKSKLL